MKDKNKPDKKLTKDELIKQRYSEEYAAILNVLPDIVYKIDPDGHFTYISDSVKDLGYSPEELIGKHFSEIVYPDDVASISRKTVLPKYKGKVTGDKGSPGLFDERRTGKRSTKNLVFRLIPKKHEDQHDSQDIESSEPVYVEVMTSGQYAQDVSMNKSMFIGTVGIIRNVTERIQLTRKKAELEEQLHQSQKMEAIGQLAGGIAHDFNNILGAISGYAVLISKRFGSDNPKLVKYSKIILSGAIRASDLTEKLLTFAMKGRSQKISMDIHKTIMDAIQLLAHSIDKQIKISQELYAKNPNILGEPNQIQNAIINIALNARDAMPNGGDLLFKTENVFLDEKSLQSHGQNITKGKYLLLSIKDTGEGMDEETKSRIFEPFFTTKESGKGTGLGLASVYGIVEAHNGTINVESTQGKGTIFNIYLPVDEESVKGEKAST